MYGREKLDFAQSGRNTQVPSERLLTMSSIEECYGNYLCSQSSPLSALAVALVSSSLY